MTAPMQVDYGSIQRVWREADGIPEIAHAWLFDHLIPIAGPPEGPVFEGWTLLSALAAQTRRLRVGLMVTSNRVRPPALLAKIAATVDVVAGGRLDFGFGVGSRPDWPLARREYESYGLPYHEPAEAVERFAEACAVIKRLWTEDRPFDVDETHVTLTDAFCNPKPVGRPPFLIGGRSSKVLRIVAAHADIWNTAPAAIDDVRTRSRRLDGYCAEIGRDPATITRSVTLPVDYDNPATTRDRIEEFAREGFSHVVLSLPAPYPTGAAGWVADEVVREFSGSA